MDVFVVFLTKKDSLLVELIINLKGSIEELQFEPASIISITFNNLTIQNLIYIFCVNECMSYECRPTLAIVCLMYDALMVM